MENDIKVDDICLIKKDDEYKYIFYIKEICEDKYVGSAIYIPDLEYCDYISHPFDIRSYFGEKWSILKINDFESYKEYLNILFENNKVIGRKFKLKLLEEYGNR